MGGSGLSGWSKSLYSILRVFVFITYNYLIESLGSEFDMLKTGLNDVRSPAPNDPSTSLSSGLASAVSSHLKTSNGIRSHSFGECSPGKEEHKLEACSSASGAGGVLPTCSEAANWAIAQMTSDLYVDEVIKSWEDIYCWCLLSCVRTIEICVSSSWSERPQMSVRARTTSTSAVAPSVDQSSLNSKTEGQSVLAPAHQQPDWSFRYIDLHFQIYPGLNHRSVKSACSNMSWTHGLVRQTLEDLAANVVQNSVEMLLGDMLQMSLWSLVYSLLTVKAQQLFDFHLGLYRDFEISAASFILPRCSLCLSPIPPSPYAPSLSSAGTDDYLTRAVSCSVYLRVTQSSMIVGCLL